MGEVDRRREKQIAFNKQNGITPKTIQKKITDIMEGAREDDSGHHVAYGRVASKKTDYNAIPDTPKALGKLLTSLENKMMEHAKNLEFEEAANVRDELKRLRETALLN